MTDDNKSIPNEVESSVVDSNAAPATSKAKKTAAPKSQSSSKKTAATKKASSSNTTKKASSAQKSSSAGSNSTAAKSASASRSASAKSTAGKSSTSKSTTSKSTTTKSTAAKSTATTKKTASEKTTTANPVVAEEPTESTEKTVAPVADEVAAAVDTTEAVSASVESEAATQEPEVKEPVQAAETQTTEPTEDASAESDAIEKHGDKDYILEVDGLKTYFSIQKTLLGKTTVYLRAVDNVGFKIERGTTLGVVGESGCGKTTLGRTILKLYDPKDGKIVFNGDDLTHLKRNEMLKYRTKMQLIFQDPYSSLPPRMTVGSIIAEAVKIHNIVPKEEVYDYVQGVMKMCGLQPQYYDRYPHEFSGGQRQRICIARALAVKPELVVCDEPVSALDVSIQAQIINLLKSLQQQMGLTYLFISHDLSVVKYITDRILVMYLGNMMELGDTNEIFDNPLHPYTQALFSAVPTPDPDIKMNRIILEGDIPSPANPPKGCKFHTRCSKCMDVCKFKVPQYVSVKSASGADHYVACHLYDEAVMSSLDEYSKRYEELMAEQAANEEAARIKKENSIWYKCKTKVVRLSAKIVGVFKKKKTADVAPTAASVESEAKEPAENETADDNSQQS